MASTGRVCIVAHDFSTFAERAADTALDDLLDSRRGGRIVLVHVMPAASFDVAALGAAFISVENELRGQAARALEGVAERLRKREALLCAGPPPVAIEATIRVGSPAEGIVDEAAARGAERVFVGTHGRSGLNHLLLGSVAERIARHARVPVVVVHGTRADLEGATA